MAYQDWLYTQELYFVESRSLSNGHENRHISWILNRPELYSCRAPGNTCLSALQRQKSRKGSACSYLDIPQNDSKGCGGIMRVAPLALKAYPHDQIKWIDHEGAEIAAITHGHSLGYMPALP